MFGESERQTRTLLGPADPARFEVPPAPVSAVALIDRAEATPHAPAVSRWRLAVPRRRVLIVATAATVAVAAAATYALTRPGAGMPDFEPYRPALALEPLAVPMAYEVTDNPPPAGERLREIAAQLTAAPYEGRSGAYEYHRYLSWGAVGVTSPEGYDINYVEDFETWIAPDRSGWQRHTFVDAQFRDEASRAYYESNPDPEALRFPQSYVNEIYSDSDWFDIDEVPTDHAGLAELFDVEGEGGFDFGMIQELYRDHIVPTEARRAVLEVLAEVPGFVWRGEVTDRAGRSGVAISYDSGEPGYVIRWVLVFDPDTGELLASEYIDLQDEYLSYYALYLATGWTDAPGRAPAARIGP
jgi:hypothetical protein